jgi:hypothetical protein
MGCDAVSRTPSLEGKGSTVLRNVGNHFTQRDDVPQDPNLQLRIVKRRVVRNFSFRVVTYIPDACSCSYSYLMDPRCTWQSGLLVFGCPLRILWSIITLNLIKNSLVTVWKELQGQRACWFAVCSVFDSSAGLNRQVQRSLLKQTASYDVVC